MSQKKPALPLQKQFVVVAIHGEGDRDTVNKLEKHRYDLEIKRFNNAGATAPVKYYRDPDEPPDVMIILRDENHDFRLEWPVDTWEEVEAWKNLAGWDADKRHWKSGAKITVSIF